MIEGVHLQLRAQLPGKADVTCIIQASLAKDQDGVGVLELDQLSPEEGV